MCSFVLAPSASSTKTRNAFWRHYARPGSIVMLISTIGLVSGALWSRARQLNSRKDRALPKEVERKFLVNTARWRAMAAGTLYRQGYLSSVKERVVRVRIAEGRGFLTIKGLTTGLSRLEFEYPIPLADATVMMDQLCERPLIEKTRYREVFAGRTWEIDVFHGDNDGLVVAEVEIENPEDRIEQPHWAGAEVSNDPRYFNHSLAAHPYRYWRNNHA
jgi:adenylate cyclase